MIVFKVNQGSEFYKKYFKSVDENKKFKQLAIKFLRTYFPLSITNIELSSDLKILFPTPEHEKAYSDQLQKSKDQNGKKGFIRNSFLAKKWQSEVMAQIDYSCIKDIRFWYAPYFSHMMSFDLWDINGEVFGYLHGDNEQLPKNTTQIRASTIFAIIESESA